MSKSIDAHNKPPTVGFNRTRNIDKAAYVLKGIIDGDNVDGNLVDAEILYLDAWMRGRNSLGLQVIAFDLYQAVNRALEDQHRTPNERIDLNELIQNLIEFSDESRTPDDESHINEFLSMLKAICANGIVIQPEINRVEAWISANRDISKAFPIKPVYNQVRDAVNNNPIVENPVNEQEIAKLDEMLTQFTGDISAKAVDVDNSIGQAYCDDDELFSFGR